MHKTMDGLLQEQYRVPGMRLRIVQIPQIALPLFILLFLRQAACLEVALRQLTDDGRLHDPIMENLDKLAPGIAERSVYALVADVLSTINL